MKKRSIGEITRGGGFPAAIREVREGGEPIFITKGNESVAILFPSTPEFERYMIQAAGFLEVIRSLRRDGYAQEASEFLAVQMAIGTVASVLLAVDGKGEVAEHLRGAVTERFASFAKNRTEDRATVGIDPSAVPMESKGRRRKPAALPNDGSVRAAVEDLFESGSRPKKGSPRSGKSS